VQAEVQHQYADYPARYLTPAADSGASYGKPTARYTLAFYTSDQPGRYRVVVEGLSPSGLTGSTSLTLEVKAAL
jgi:hypothetical protein